MVAVLSNAGDQAPVMPLLEVVGNADNTAPEQIGATAANAGVIWLVITISIVAGAAH